jgi:O-antigen ligase
MFVLAEVIVVANPPWFEKFKATLTPWIIGVGVILSVFAVLQVTVIPKDFLANFGYDKDTTIAPYLLVDQDPNALRAFATMRGPNTLAAYLLLPLAVAIAVWWHNRRAWWALGSAALMMVALALTGSRSGWLGAAAALAALAYATLPRETLLRWIKFGIVPLVAVAGIVLWLAITVPAVRLAIFHSGGNDPNESLTEGSSDKHWQAALIGIQQIVSDPLGQGVGSAGPASFYNTAEPPSIAEDYYVQIGQEAGVAGIAFFILISAMVAKRLWQQQDMPRALLASFIGIAVINLFLHGWADDPTAMTWWGIAGLFIARPAVKRVQSK